MAVIDNTGAVGIVEVLKDAIIKRLTEYCQEPFEESDRHRVTVISRNSHQAGRSGQNIIEVYHGNRLAPRTPDQPILQEFGGGRGVTGIFNETLYSLHSMIYLNGLGLTEDEAAHIASGVFARIQEAMYEHDWGNLRDNFNEKVVCLVGIEKFSINLGGPTDSWIFDQWFLLKFWTHKSRSK